MNCERIQEIEEQFLTGELPEEQQAEVQTHLADCPRCRERVDQARLMDGRIRDALACEALELQPLRERIRAQLSRARPEPLLFGLVPRRVALAVLGAMIPLVIIVNALWMRQSIREFYRAVIKDHVDDVVLRVPKPLWETTQEGMQRLSHEWLGAEVSLEDITLQGAKIVRVRPCNLAGERFLHYVLDKDGHEYSLFLRMRKPGFQFHGKCSPVPTKVPLYEFAERGYAVAAFQGPRCEVILVDEGPQEQLRAEALQAIGRFGVAHTRGL